MADSSIDHITALLVRGPALAAAEVAFLKASGPFEHVYPVDETGVELGPILRLISRSGLLRSDFPFWKMNSSAIDQIADRNFLWLPDPWISLSRHGAALARNLEKPYVVTVWENISGHFTARWPLRGGTAEVLHHANLIHCVSAGSERYVAEICRGKVETTLVHPGIDIAQFSPSLRALNAGTEHDTYTFLFVGRLVEEKGVPEILTAFSRIRRRFGSEVRLVIIGSGPLEPVVTLAAAQEPRGISYLGSLPHEELPAVMARCHTLLLPSKSRRVGPVTIWREQFGLVLVEAMACGLTIIATDFGAIPEVVGDVGFLIDSGEDTADALAAAMFEAIKHAAGWARESERARERAVRYFSAQTNSAILWRQIRRSL